MRKIYFLLSMMVLALGIPLAAQEQVKDYVEEFEGLNVSNHGFAPKGWGHIVDYYSSYYDDDQYVEYSNPETGGAVDGGSYLSIGSQQLGSGWSSETVKDMLVTPAVSGNVSLYVKKERTSGSIAFYTCTKSGNSFTAGAAYEAEIPELSETEWVQVTLPAVPEGTYLGIRGEYVGIDKFSAENATIVLKRELKISKVTMVTGDNVDANEDGNATVTFEVTLSNTGEVDFNPSDEGYSVSIVNFSNSNEVMSTLPLTFSLAAGATSEPFNVSATIAVTEQYRPRYDIMENISGSTAFGGWVQFYPYESDFFLSYEDHADVLESGTEVQFGLTQQPVTKGFRLRNNSGGAPARLSSITVPEGFTYKVTDYSGAEVTALPATIPAHEEFALEVTMLADVPGSKNGNMVIKADGYDDFIYPLTGQVVDLSKFYVNFEDNKFPAGSYLESDSWKVSNYPSTVDMEANSYCAENGNTDPTKFVTPKLRVAEGETMVFSAAQRSSSSIINVYYSPDREEWTLVRSLSADAENDADKFTDEKLGSSYDEYAFKQFTIDNIPAGDWYMAFESGYARLDDIMGYTLLEVPAVDFVVTGLNLPATATVNHDYSANISLYNSGSNAVEDGQLSAKLYVGGNAVAEQAVPATAVGSSATISFTYTPRQQGDFTARIVIESQGETVVERSAELSIAGETPSADYSLGTYNQTSSNVPLSLNYNNSDSETIYTKDLIGFPAGAKILQLTYRGYKTTETHKAHIRVWIENTTDGIFESNPEDLHPTDDMTQIYDGDYTFEQKGSSSDIQDMLVIPLEEPFEYTGENLRVIVRAEKIDQYKSVSFECDRNVQYASAYRRSDSAVPTGSLTRTSELPVVHVLIEKDLTVLSGKVVSSKDQSPIEGAAIKLVSGNVEYSGVSGEDGSYSIGVYQDRLEYALTAEKAGYFKTEKTVTFPEGSTTMDIAMDEATGFRIKESSVPAAGMVNHAYTATVTIENGLEKAPGSYTAELYVGGEVVASDSEAALEADSEHVFTFSYTPHAAGTFPAYVKLTSDYGTTQTDEIQLAIAEESAEAVVQVGVNDKLSTTDGPIYTTYQTSRTEIIYTKELISMESGTKIISLQFKGYTGGKSDLKYDTQIWIENVSSTEFKENDVDGMTLIYDGEVDLSEAKGSSDESVALIDVQIPDGFVYTGENIRIVTAAQGNTWATSYFEVQDITGYAKHKFADKSSLEDLDNDASKEWQDIALPVAYFGVEPTKSVSGTVTDSETGLPIEGADITLSSGGVEYYGTTDADGTYTVTVIQHTLDYVMTVKADGYLTATENISFADGNAEKDVALEKDNGSGVASVGTEGFNAYGGSGCIFLEAEAETSVYVYNTLGVLVRRVDAAAGKTRIEGIGAGVYIVNGKKVLVR